MTGASVKACFSFTYLTDTLRNVGSRKIALCVGCTFIKDARILDGMGITVMTYSVIHAELIIDMIASIRCDFNSPC